MLKLAADTVWREGQTSQALLICKETVIADCSEQGVTVCSSDSMDRALTKPLMIGLVKYIYRHMYREALTEKTRQGTDCGSDRELLIAKFRLKLKKVWKTTRPFRYDLNQIPYNYTVKVTNRFKGLDLIDRVPEELWTEVVKLYRSQ